MPEVPQYDMKYIKLSDLTADFDEDQSRKFCLAVRMFRNYNVGDICEASEVYSSFYDVAYNSTQHGGKRIELVNTLMETIKKYPKIYIKMDI